MQQKATTKNKQTYFSYNVIIFIPENKISNSVQVFLVFIIIIIIIIFFFHQNGSADSAGSRDC